MFVLVSLFEKMIDQPMPNLPVDVETDHNFRLDPDTTQ
jgi:hypothetical protein